MADSGVVVAPASSGATIDCQSVVNAASVVVLRQTVTNGDPSLIGAVQSVKLPNAAATPADGAAVVIVRPDGGGSTGNDWSANGPTIPNVGAAFSGGDPHYPGWSVVRTIPANPGRFCATVVNMNPTPILIVRDDGTALSGALPSNASAFTLGARVSTGPEGGMWSTTTFRGRIQIYALSSAAVISAFTD